MLIFVYEHKFSCYILAKFNHKFSNFGIQGYGREGNGMSKVPAGPTALM